MKRIVILLEEKWHTESLPDAAAAVRAYQEYGFDTDLWILEEQDRITGEQSAIPNEPTSDTVTGPNGPHSSILSPEVADTLFIADSERLLRQLAEAGADILVAGSAVFRAADPAGVIAAMRGNQRM